MNSSILDSSAILSEHVDWTLDVSLGPLIGLLALALAVFAGLSRFTGGVGGHLVDIKNDVKGVRERLEDIWNLRPGPLFGGAPAAATVVRRMEHLGKVTISAKPAGNSTVYVINVERPVIREGLIVKLSQGSAFEADIEERMFGKNHPRVLERSGTSLLVDVPTADAQIATEYMTLFLEWLDTEYMSRIDQEIDDFERPILGDHASS